MKSFDEVYDKLSEEGEELAAPAPDFAQPESLEMPSEGPKVILIVGENDVDESDEVQKFFVGIFDEESEQLIEARSNAKSNYDRVYETELDFNMIDKQPLANVFEFI